jgi:hypothetical protein
LTAGKLLDNNIKHGRECKTNIETTDFVNCSNAK